MANEELVIRLRSNTLSVAERVFVGGVFTPSEETFPFCKADHVNKTYEESVEELMKRMEANDAGSMMVLGSHYYHGKLRLLRDQGKAIELWKQAAALGSSMAHFHLGDEYREGGDSKKSKFHYEAAAMAGNEDARNNIGTTEARPEIWYEL
jgi:TPR repeat protein